jgi:MFS superfamily sulfate permease-like transporter
MSEATKTNNSNTFLQDFTASIVVFLVALPLCLGIAQASGVPPALGLITGIIGGIVVGALAGSPLQVSGPAAGLLVIILEIVGRYNVKKEGLAALGLIVLGAGLLQILAGLFKVGRWFRAVSPAVIQGMLAGIGVLIFGSQFHVMVDDASRKGGLANLISIPESIYKGVFPMDGNPHNLAALVGLTTIVVLVGWNTLRPKKLNFLPGPLVAVVAATALAIVMGFKINFVKLPDNLFSAVTLPGGAIFLKLLADPRIYVSMLTVALVASAETLLCASAVDKMHQGVRTDYDKELFAQGIGNTLCGIAGALPMTGVIVRSSANVEAGGKTRMSAILHGIWLLGLVLLAPWLLKLIPSACLAAILVFTGYKLMNVKVMKELWQTSKSEFAIYTATVVMIVATDLLTGVLIGIVLSCGKLIYTFTHLEIVVNVDEHKGQADVFLEGSATFIVLPKVAEALESLPSSFEQHIHLGGLAYVDHACLELFQSHDLQIQATGGSVVVEWDALQDRFYTKPEMKPGQTGERASVRPRPKLSGGSSH